MRGENGLTRVDRRAASEAPGSRWSEAVESADFLGTTLKTAGLRLSAGIIGISWRVKRAFHY